MLTVIFSIVIILSLSTKGISQTSNEKGTSFRFLENKGQIVDFDYQVRDEFLYYTKSDKLDIYFRNNGITYIFKSGDSIPNVIGLTIEEREKIMKDFFNKKTLYYRLDVDFFNANYNIAIEGDNKSEYYSNFYFSHCPDGILNVNSFDKIKYTNVYNGIDFEFYFSNNKFKYDIIIEPNADINNIELEFKSGSNIFLEGNEISIQAPVGDIIESLPRSYYINEQEIKTDTEIKYELVGNIVKFKTLDELSNTLIIDPQISWTTYYDDCFWNGLGSSIDVKGTQCVISSYAFNNNFPTLNPGGSAYYQNTNAGSGDFQILKFNTDGVLIWATYYGGTGYDNMSHIKLDYNGNIILAGHTESTNIPCQNSGGYYDGTYDAGTYGGGTFIVKFNSSGVRQWATHYDYVSYPFVEVDLNNNIYVVGRSHYNDPPVLALGGAYNQALIAHDGGGTNHSTDIFIVKFNASTTRVWATNLGGSTDEFPQDLKCGSDNYLNILALSDCYSGTGMVTYNPGGGAYYDNTTGPSSTNRDDLLLYRFNTSGAMVWGTAFGGTANDNGQQGRITTDNSNNIYIYAETINSTIPLTNPGGGAYFDNTFAGGSGFNPFLARFSSGGVLTWCTFFGTVGLGYGMNFSNYLGVNDSGNLIAVTTTASSGTTFPLVPRDGDYNATLSVYMGVYIAEFTSNLSIAWSTYYAGTTDRHTLGDASLSSNSCGYELYMTTNWEKWNAAATDPPWVKPIPTSYQNTTFFTTTTSGLISRFSNAPSVAPTGITASLNPVCAGSSTTLTVVGGTLGSGAAWHWYSGSCGGTEVGTGASISVSPASTTTYYVRAEGICNTTSCASVTVTVNTLSIAPTSASANPASVCSGTSTNITLTASGGTLGTGSVTQWYTGSCGGTFIGEGNPLVVSQTLSSNTTYYVRYSGTCNTTTCASTTVSIGSSSTAPTTISGTTTICSGGSTTLTASGGTMGIGASYQWYAGGCGSGSVLGTESSITVSPASNTTYYVRRTGPCNTTACISQLVTVVADPAISTQPVGGSICGEGSKVLSVVASGGTPSLTYQWYNSSGAISGATSSSYTATTAGNYYCIVSASGSGCGSAVSNQASVTIQSPPVAVITGTNSICAGLTSVLSAASSVAGSGSITGYQWYYNNGVTNSQISGATGVTYTASLPGIYSVEITDSNGCTSITCP